MDIKPFEKKVWLASPMMHGEEQQYVAEAFEKNWITTAGDNINEWERMVAQKVGVEYAVGLASGTAGIHMACKLAGLKLYGQPEFGKGSLLGKRVFCSDMTFDATVNPVVYEGGIPVFIDSEYETWNMDPIALEKAFEIYPEVKLIVMAHLYGTPAKMDEIRRIADAHDALIIEDAAEAFGATYNGKQAGSFGNYGILSGNGNKIITSSSGGFLLTNSKEDCDKVKKWSTQAREAAPWYQHEELGYNYRMSNITAGIGRGQMYHLEEHIRMKKNIYERYCEGFKDLPIAMNPYEKGKAVPNYWLSCMIINSDAMGRQVRSENEALYIKEDGKTTPTEILETLLKYNAEGRPIWKPMHMQPIYRLNGFVTSEGNGRARTNVYIDGGIQDIGMDIFSRGLCLPSDINMTAEQQDIIIEIVKRCFD